MGKLGCLYFWPESEVLPSGWITEMSPDSVSHKSHLLKSMVRLPEGLKFRMMMMLTTVMKFLFIHYVKSIIPVALSKQYFDFDVNVFSRQQLLLFTYPIKMPTIKIMQLSQYFTPRGGRGIHSTTDIVRLAEIRWWNKKACFSSSPAEWKGEWMLNLVGGREEERMEGLGIAL